MCSAVDFESTNVRLFLDNDEFASQDVATIPQYPFTVEPLNATYNALVGGVGVQILEAGLNPDDQDSASFNTTLTGNISALQAAGVTNISCGLRNANERRYIDILFNSNAGT